MGFGERLDWEELGVGGWVGFFGILLRLRFIVWVMGEKLFLGGILGLEKGW